MTVSMSSVMIPTIRCMQRPRSTASITTVRGVLPVLCARTGVLLDIVHFYSRWSADGVQ